MINIIIFLIFIKNSSIKSIDRLLCISLESKKIKSNDLFYDYEQSQTKIIYNFYYIKFLK